MIRKPDFEKLAELEHDQWCMWSKAIARDEIISDERLNRWNKLWKPYDELTDVEKDNDRVYAHHVEDVLRDYTHRDEIPDTGGMIRSAYVIGLIVGGVVGGMIGAFVVTLL